jgi:hypothetical protein
MLIGTVLGYKKSFFLIGLFLALSACVLLTTKAEAATFTVGAGTDGVANDSVCRLSEALQNIDDQAQTNTDCPQGSGANDIIQLPAGTITLSRDSYLTAAATVTNTYVGVRKSIKMVGSTVGRSVIDGNSEFGLSMGGESNQVELSSFNFINPPRFGAIAVSDAAVSTINDIAVDGGNACTEFGLAVIDDVETNTAVNLTNVRVNTIDCSTQPSVSFGVVVDNSSSGLMTLTVKNMSVNSIKNGAAAHGFMYGVNIVTPSSGAVTRGSLNAEIDNVTISDIYSPKLALGMGLKSFNSSTGDNNFNVKIRNATLINITSEEGQLVLPGSSVTVQSGAYGTQLNKLSSGNVSHNETVQNMIIANSIHGDQHNSCTNVLYREEALQKYTSMGGNIVDDSTCENVFNNAKDKNNQTGLIDTLNTITNNGGAVMSVLPKAGSPVIDAGICDDAPVNDIRGISRPQGKTCDSGAIEVQQASVAGRHGIESAQAGTKIYLEVGTPHVVISAASLTRPTMADDSSYSYPYGMLGFTVDGIKVGSTQTVDVYFESDKQAKSFTGRKFIATRNTFTGLSNATISNEIRDNKPVIKLSYQITDGGDSDLDGSANGSITDPIGIGIGSGLLAETGIASTLLSIIGTILILGAVFTYVDYRKHKAPLIDIDKELQQNLAKKYTFWHHLKVVTIPTARYKFIIRLEKKIDITA